MKKLWKYLKPFGLGILLSFALLFVQAICDLNLPNLMSDIVTVGVQQSGVEHASPPALSAQAMEFIGAYMTDQQRALVEAHYIKVEAEGAYAARYPAASGEIYALRDTDTGQRAALDEAFGKASWTFVSVMQDMMAAMAGQQGEPDAETGGTSQMPEMNLEMIYQYQPMITLIAASKIPDAQKIADGAPEMLIKSSGIALAQAYMRELGVDLGRTQTSYVLRIGLYMLLVTLIGGVATVLVGLLSSRISAGVARALRKDIFTTVTSFGATEIDRFSTASLITRSTNDVTQIQMFIMMGIRMLCYAPIMLVGGMIMALSTALSLSWIIALAGAVVVGLIAIVFSLAVPRFKIIQKLIDRLNLVAREGLSGLMVIRAFRATRHEEERFEKANDDLTRVNLFINRVMVFMFPVMMLVMNGASLLIVWVGGHEIAAGAMQVGSMLAFIQYAMQVIMSFMFVSMIFMFWPRAEVSAARIDEVLKTEPVIRDPDNPKSFDEAKRGVVEFVDVSFRYQGAEQDALHALSFTALPGQTTAIIGATGSGKSTIAHLLLRFYDATSGKVMLGGVDIRDVAQHELRRHIGYVPQKGVLLSGTIKSNIAYGDTGATMDQIETSARVAQAEDFIAEKPEQYDDIIAQGGANVSGGQKQRLSIARALTKQPEVYVFDDSFSALDFRTDIQLRRALRGYTASGTIIIVAQRVSTIMHADQILVLDKGAIVGRGTHKELLSTCPEYEEIASSQLTKEELA